MTKEAHAEESSHRKSGDAGGMELEFSMAAALPSAAETAAAALGYESHGGYARCVGCMGCAGCAG